VIRVAIQPYGDFDTRLADSVASTFRKTYHVETIILTSKPLPSKAFTKVKTPRYRADVLLVHLMDIKPDTVEYIIGITSQDISTTKRDVLGNIKSPKEKYADWGILGLGYCPGPSCVISTFRIGHKSQKKFMERLKKISLHELGHNIGLDHCETNDCVMQDAAETIKTIDRAQKSLCTACKTKVGLQSDSR
jgi:archaemetzincin